MTAAAVEVNSHEPSWLEVEDRAGSTLYYGLLQGRRRFPLGEGLRLRSGRPDLIRIRVGSQPEQPLGTVYENGWHTIQAASPEG